MPEFTFTLRFAIDNAESYIDKLYEAGCDDALIGLGTPGVLALEFIRRAETLKLAIESAERDVLKAIPDAKQSS
jgi:hypothetical protein